MDVADLHLTLQEFNNWRGRFGRACERKQTSGRLDVPEEIHQMYLQKGTVRDNLMAQFIRANGNKDTECRVK